MNAEPSGRTGLRFSIVGLALVGATLACWAIWSWTNDSGIGLLAWLTGIAAVVCGLIGFGASVRAFMQGERAARRRGVAGLLLSLPSLALLVMRGLFVLWILTYNFE